MLRIIGLAACLVTASMGASPVLAQAAREANITNADVIQLVAAGLDEELVIASVRAGVPNFDTTPAGLLELQTAGVPKSVISAMITSAAAQRIIGKAAPVEELKLSTDALDPTVPHVPGVYMLNANGYSDRMRRVEGTVAELENVGGGLMSVATMGMMGGEKRAKLKGAAALVQTRVRTPEFYMYFNDSVPDSLRMHAGNTWVSGGTEVGSPDDLQLVRFDASKSHREARVGEKLKEKHEILFSSERVAHGVYRVTVRSLLKPGAYGFVQSLKANDGKGKNTARIFDFQVQ